MQLLKIDKENYVGQADPFILKHNDKYYFSGSKVNNYIWFNCSEGTTSGSENCELWRIVGMFNVKGHELHNNYRRIKLVREENIKDEVYGSTSYDTSTINTYLNGEYYEGLTDSAKKMIINGPFNIGTTSLTSTANESITNENTKTIYTKVGLLTASDIGYTNSDQTITLDNTNLLANSWLNGKSFYTINNDGTNIISSNGTSLTTIENTTSYGIKPSVYLSPTVSIIGGNGTSEKPFELSYLDIEEHYDELIPSDLYRKMLIEAAPNLTEPDVDGTRYLQGDVTNNYVWYSGKLWRIVGLNSDGTVKLVTQGNMTTIAWDTSSTNTDYSTSQIRNWLKNEFLPTINQDLITESIWDYTTYEEFPTTKLTPTNTVTDKVGLLTIYDYAMTGGTTDENTSSTFLNNGYYWWTMSPRTSGSNVWGGDYLGYASNYNPAYSDGVRPSVNLRSDIRISKGSGRKESPYILEGDAETGKANDSLNTRISGEYIRFNNVLYRIVGTEEVNGKLLTKVTMADYSVNNNTIGSVAFGANTSEITFSPSYGIGLYLENWYQANSGNTDYATTYISDAYKTMIATASDGVVWYAGPDSGGTGDDYTKAKTGTPISATIGLGRYGEMFSSQFRDGYGSSIETWLMTKYSSSDVWCVTPDGDAAYYSLDYIIKRGVRPSFYLKSDVKIVSGNGQPDEPYELVME